MAPRKPPTNIRSALLKLRYVPPQALVERIEGYMRQMASLEGAATSEVEYSVSRAVTELIELGLASIPQDELVLQRAAEGFRQARSQAWTLFRVTMGDLERQIESYRRDLNETLVTRPPAADGHVLRLGPEAVLPKPADVTFEPVKLTKKEERQAAALAEYEAQMAAQTTTGPVPDFDSRWES